LIIVIDKDRKMTYRSPSAERVTGWSNEDSEHVDIFQRIHPDDLEKGKGI
jgi:PAS domain S-box-containing protein